MSLTRFVEKPDVRAKLECFRPAGPRRIPSAMLVPPQGGNASRIGTAFDYLLRFELQRRVPKAEAAPWIAERARDSSAIRMIVTIPDDELYEWVKRGRSVRDVSVDNGLYSVDCPRLYRRVSRVLDAATSAVATYRRKRKPSCRDWVELAGHALRLASLELAYRANLQALPADFDEAHEAEVAELMDLFAIVPFDAFDTAERTLLNPTFGAASRLVGGADADLIVGDMLIDVKTIRRQCARADYFDQLVGYFILARQARLHDPSFPLINRLALYFSRHGHLWTWDVKSLHEDRDFLALERWFVDEAAGRHTSAPRSSRGINLERPLPACPSGSRSA